MTDPHPSGSDTTGLLGDFSGAVLHALLAGGPPTEVAAAATAAAPDEVLAAWVTSWDPSLVALATELVAQWTLSGD